MSTGDAAIIAALRDDNKRLRAMNAEQLKALRGLLAAIEVRADVRDLFGIAEGVVLEQAQIAVARAEGRQI